MRAQGYVRSDLHHSHSETTLEISAHRHVHDINQDPQMLKRSIQHDLAARATQRPGEDGTRRGQRIEAERFQGPAQPPVPRPRHHEASPAVQTVEDRNRIVSNVHSTPHREAQRPQSTPTSNSALPLRLAARRQLVTQCRTGTAELVAPARRAAGRLTFKGNETHDYDPAATRRLSRCICPDHRLLLRRHPRRRPLRLVHRHAQPARDTRAPCAETA